MTETITEDQPRIKFQLIREGHLMIDTPPDEEESASEVIKLGRLMQEMEALGACPILNDGKVGGNCAIKASHVLEDIHQRGRNREGSNHHQQHRLLLNDQEIIDPASSCSSSLLISRSGKAPGAMLEPNDFVLVQEFDRKEWKARFSSQGEDRRPSSDTPLLWSTLGSADAKARYLWGNTNTTNNGSISNKDDQCPSSYLTSSCALSSINQHQCQPLLPNVAIHGHALAEGEGLDYAMQQGLPISERETLFSTPEDLYELEQLLVKYPYPQHRCFIRKGHGFFVLGTNVDDVRATMEELILPYLRQNGNHR